MNKYQIVVKNSNGDSLGEFEKFRNLKFSKKLNDYSECSFEIPVNEAKASDLISLRIYTVWIYRNGDLLWAGEQALRQGELNAKGDNWVTITAYSWLEQLNSRYTVNEIIYEYQDGTLIAKDLIDQTQADTNGDLGITFGTTPETTWREKTYTNQNVLDAITSLANLIDGFDFELTDAKVFNISNFIGVDRTDEVILEYGVNLKSAKITEDFSKPTNRAIVLGQTGTVGDAIRVERDDAAKETQYGLRESTQSMMEVSELTAIEAMGDSVLRKYGAPLLKVSLDIVRGKTPTIDDFALGDIIRVKIKNGIYNIDSSFRIFEWGLNYDANDTETLSLTLSDFHIEEFS